MVFDSFTSNWQGALFKKFSMSSIQMMCGVNFFSTLFTITSLTIQGGLSDSFDFATKVDYFLRHLNFFKLKLLYILAPKFPFRLHYTLSQFCTWSTIHLLYNRIIWSRYFYNYYDNTTGTSCLALMFNL